MRRKRSMYLSFRVFILFAVLFALLFLFLIIITIDSIQWSRNPMIVLLGYLAFSAAVYAFYWWIYRPYQENAKSLKLFLSGYSVRSLFDQGVLLSPEIEEITKKVEKIINTDELVNASKKQAQYLALQNQINPHFLYNTLEGIRGETLNAGLENVSNMAEALATFFRYTISNVENLVLLEDELANVKNYYIIQRYRFGERLNLSVEYDDPENEMKIMTCKLPKLTLQPIVENAIYHGIERKIGKGTVRIRIETTASRLIITISDNGVGMTEERLREINNKLNRTTLEYIKPNDETHNGIATVNVNNRIKLLFGEEYGICMYSTLNVGTDVEITLPLLEGDRIK